MAAAAMIVRSFFFFFRGRNHITSYQEVRSVSGVCDGHAEQQEPQDEFEAETSVI